MRVLVAEDSLTVRELLVAILESDPEIEVVGQAKDGAEAVELAERLRPDIITMDIQMPVLDGLEATKEIMVRRPTPVVVVSASTSKPDVQRSFDAIRAGALMLLEKPQDPRSPAFDGRRERFLQMVKAMAEVKVVRRWAQPAPRPRRPPTGRRPPPGTIKIVLIAASTGGPAALQQLLGALPRDFTLPVLVVQHIAAGFIHGLAEWLAASCNLRVKVAEDDGPLAARTVYLAPDNRHLGLARDGRARLSDADPVGGHRPSADFLFAAAVSAYGAEVLAVVLTGMGRDGADGARSIKDRGGWVLAQDEATSVVYGMNREVVQNGCANEVLPLEQLGPAIVELVQGRSSDDG
ncbi:MAG: chemotaxis-specific protein-glutamate methyltransferase CheB [Gemmatimonadetes bacterium]|nr:chemotaxis-specific protein-glutamate methyltransferase CheB [Gemmatimonadota bacterium]